MPMNPAMPPDAMGEPSGGLLPSVGHTAAWLASQRAGTSARTLMHGTTKGSGAFYRYAGFRHTPEEVRAWQSGRYAMTGWKNPLWNRLDDRLGLGGKGIFGTVYAPSTWMAAPLLAENPTKYGSHFANAAMGRDLSSKIERGNYRLSPKHSMATGGFNPKAAMEGRVTIPGGAGNLTEASFAAALNKSFRFGSTAKTSLVQDFGAGLWFRGVDNPSLSISKSLMDQREVYLKNIGKGGVRGKISDVAMTGLTRRVTPISSAEVAGGQVFTPFAKHTGRITMGAGLLARAAGHAYMGALAGKGIYKIAEGVHYKIPKSVFTQVRDQMMRPMFVSAADSSLLTGIPANNRQRAVQAIQGSRLNARGALGSEASAMASHFG